MTRHRVEQLLVMLVGFCVGATLAICTAPGDVLLWVVAGVVLSIFARAFFIRDLGGELLWTRPHPKKTPDAEPRATHR